MLLGSKVALLLSPLVLAASCLVTIDRDRIGDNAGTGGSSGGGVGGSGADAGTQCEPAPCEDSDPTNDIVCPGESIQQAVDANGFGHTITIKAGVHRLQTVVPISGNIFEGEPCSVLSGARVLTDFKKEGDLWVAEGQDQENPELSVDCYDGTGNQAGLFKNWPRCRHPEDLFIDDLPLRHVDALTDVIAGTWFFDYAADKIYFADDPTGHRVEASVTPIAFDGISKSGPQVTIRGLVIEKYAGFQAIGCTNHGQWTIEGNEIRLTHGWAINLYSGKSYVIRDNDIHNNGMGITISASDTAQVENNQITSNADTNGWPGITTTYAQGLQLISTVGSIVKLNQIRANGGDGIRVITSNTGYAISENRVEQNHYEGIELHTSCAGTVSNNEVYDNGTVGIAVLRSKDAEIFGNKISGNGSTFFPTVHPWASPFQISLQDLGDYDESFPCKQIATVNVHDNTITVEGEVKAVDLMGDFAATAGVQFVANTYNLSGSPPPFRIGTTEFSTLKQWNDAGYH